MPLKKLQDYLDRNQAKYVRISHSPAYTALEIAAAAHIPGQEVAKTVIIKVNGNLAMAVLPASYQVDFDLLQDAVGRPVSLATETEFQDRFPRCELGAMPPFGNLYDMPVYVAASLAEDDEIAFNAGSHTELVRMPYRTFADLVKPVVMRFAAARAMA